MPPPAEESTTRPERSISRAPLVVTVAALALAGALVILGSRLAGNPAPTPDLSRPGTPEQPRPVNVILRDYVFNPTPLYLVAGETVEFRLINAGLVEHEFVIGDAAVQQAWASAYAAATPGGALATQPPVFPAPGTDGLEARLKSGESRSLTYVVPAGAPLQLVCHLPGHVERGMVGRVILAAR